MAILQTLFQNSECDFYVSSVVGQWFLARRACGLWGHKYRVGSAGHDQSIRAGKSVRGTDVIKRKTLGLQYRVDMDYKTRRRWRTVEYRGSSLKDRIVKRTKLTKNANGCKSVHALTDYQDRKRDVRMCLCTHVYECLWEAMPGSICVQNGVLLSGHAAKTDNCNKNDDRVV